MLSKKNRSYVEKTTSPANRRTTQDAFSNQLARLGFGEPNMLSSTSYDLSRFSRDYNTLNALYRNNWIVRKIINIIPDDMCKNWFTITANLTPEQTDRIDKVVRKTKVKAKIVEAMYWGRLYGGAGAVKMLEGHEDILDQPLKLDEVGPNSFKGLMVLDRWSGIFPGAELITDLGNPDFGLPEFYDIKDIASGNILQKVHHTRVLRFIGRLLPFWENLAEIHWGASEIEHLFDELAKRDNTSYNIASLVFQANCIVNKVDGLDQMMAMSDPEQQRDFYNVKSAQNQMRSNQGMMLIGKNDDIQSLQYTFGGLNDIYQSFMMDIAGACEIPVTKLFGRSPAGMNATGESDMQMYYDLIAQQQNTTLLPIIEQLYPIIFMSEFGVLPKDLGYKFNPIRTPSDQEMAELVSRKVTAIGEAFDRNLITQRCAVKELHELSYTTNMFSSISDKNIEDAEDTYGGGDEMSGMGGLMGSPEMESPENISGGEIPETGGVPAATPPSGELPGSSSQVPTEINSGEGR